MISLMSWEEQTKSLPTILLTQVDVLMTVALMAKLLRSLRLITVIPMLAAHLTAKRPLLQRATQSQGV
jgi:hypothetical protein